MLEGQTRLQSCWPAGSVLGAASPLLPSSHPDWIKQGRFDGNQINLRCFTPGSCQDEFGLCLCQQQHRFFCGGAAQFSLIKRRPGRALATLFNNSLRAVFTACRFFQILRYPSLSWEEINPVLWLDTSIEHQDGHRSSWDEERWIRAINTSNKWPQKRSERVEKS